jgi:hypothetical protein
MRRSAAFSIRTGLLLEEKEKTDAVRKNQYILNGRRLFYACMDLITIKTPNPKGGLFLKIELIKGFGGSCLSV